jgi:AcrR family transcriptional regulator
MSDNRLMILNQALHLFASRGYDAVGVQEIAVAAGITKPTLYYYFGSKEGVLKVLLEDNFRDLTQKLQRAADYHGDIVHTLTLVTRTFFEFARGHDLFYRMQLAMYFAPPDSEPAKLIRRFHEEQHQILEEMFKHAAQGHGNMRNRHQRYAVTLRGMIDTYIGLYLNGYVQLNDEVLHLAVGQYMYGIFS